MNKELTFILNGKHGMYLPIIGLVLLGAALTIAGFGYNWGFKPGALGVMSLIGAVLLFLSSNKVTVSQQAITVNWRFLGLPIDNTSYERWNLQRFDKTADGIQFVDHENTLVRTIEGFEDQQQLDQIYDFLVQWLALDPPENPQEEIKLIKEFRSLQ